MEAAAVQLESPVMCSDTHRLGNGRVMLSRGGLVLGGDESGGRQFYTIGPRGVTSECIRVQ